MWSKKEAFYLHHRNEMGLERKVPIPAACASEVEEGQVLYLWIKRNAEVPEAE